MTTSRNLDEDHTDAELMSHVGLSNKCIIVSKKNGILKINKYGSSDSGNADDNLIKLINKADKKYKISDFKKILICTGDYGITPPENVLKKQSKRKYLSYCTTAGNQDGWKYICPDFTFYGWREAGYSDFDLFCKKISEKGKAKPKYNSIVWRGHILNNVKIRQKLVKMKNNNYDFEGYSNFSDLKNHELNSELNGVFYSYEDFKSLRLGISIEEQVEKYRYIIDAPGVAYSGRLKLLLFSRRLVFIVDRDSKEFFMKDLIPWVHYVPVKEDISDLDENFKIIQQNQELENKIINNAYNFAINNLTQDKILYKWYELLSTDY